VQFCSHAFNIITAWWRLHHDALFVADLPEAIHSASLKKNKGIVFSQQVKALPVSCVLKNVHSFGKIEIR